MSKSYKFALSLVCILILGCIALGVTYLFYDKEVSEETIVLVDGGLSINYLDGNVIKEKESSEYSMRFSVTNNSHNVASYSINLVDVKNDLENISIVIKNTLSDALICETNLPRDDEKIVDDIQIASGETHNYNVSIKHNSENSFEAVLKIIEQKPTIVTFAQTILKDNAVSNTTLSAVGEAIAIEDEGLISDIDDSGSTYYFRGNVKSNYVSFGGFIWRIVRINGDGTIKLILNNAIDTVQAYYKNTDGEYYTFNASSLKTYLDSWYDYNLKDYDDYISTDKYCNDYNMVDNKFTAYIRNITNKIPTFNCLGRNVGTKIGLLTADEAIYAGALYQTNNTSFYLYNKEIVNAWWTMTPATKNDTSMNPFLINSTGALYANVSGNYNRGVRPVINLIKDISVTGNGTEESPYIIKNLDE